MILSPIHHCTYHVYGHNSYDKGEKKLLFWVKLSMNPMFYVVQNMKLHFKKDSIAKQQQKQ